MVELELLRRATRDFTQSKEFASFSNLAKKYPKDFPKEFLKHCAKFDFLGMDIPEKYGGSGLSSLGQAVVIEQICRADSGLGLSVLVQNSLTAFPIRRFGTQMQKSFYLPRMASGGIFACFALTEPNVGSDAKGIETKAYHHPQGWIIRGSKRFITGANGADIAVLFARTGAEKERENGITAFIAEIGNNPLVTVPSPYNKLGQPGSPLCEIHFDDLLVPEKAVLGQIGGGWRVVEETLKHSRVQIASQGVGIAQMALDKTESYAKSRAQFGKLLEEIPDWSNHFSILKRQVGLSRFLVQKAASHEDANDPDFFVWASLAKLVAGETALSTTSDCMLLHGGIGYIEEMGIGQLLKDALVIRIYEGTAHIQMKILEKYFNRKRIESLLPKNPLTEDFQQIKPLVQQMTEINRWKLKHPP